MMKLGKLHGAAHNFADSIAGGLSFVVPGFFGDVSIFAEAAVQKDGQLMIDLLDGTAHGSFISEEIELWAPLWRAAFPGFCSRHGLSASDYQVCRMRFISGTRGNSYVITVGDRSGRKSSREYLMPYGKRPKHQDQLGRLRRSDLPEPLD